MCIVTFLSQLRTLKLEGSASLCHNKTTSKLSLTSSKNSTFFGCGRTRFNSDPHFTKERLVYKTYGGCMIFYKVDGLQEIRVILDITVMLATFQVLKAI